jgi:hypothetical protein
MRMRFAAIPLTIVDPVPWSDPRIVPGDVRIQAVTWGHLKMIKAFVDDPTAEYGIFMEDDVYIRRDISSFLPELVGLYQRHALDVMLLGYLQPIPPVSVQVAGGYGIVGTPLTLLSYGDHQWGAQMYMMDKRWAEETLKFCAGGANCVGGTPFNPDWIMTKRGRRAMCWPMMAVEEGAITTDHAGQIAYHRRCKEANFDPSIHI